VASYPYGRGPRGRASNPFSVVPALLWLPGYLLGMSVEAFVGLFRTSSRPSGYGAPAVWGAATASILMAGVGAVLTRRLIASVIGARDALPAVVATWLGTAALYYTLVTPLYSHAVSWFGVASMLYLTQIAVTSPFKLWRWLVAGWLAGCMVAIRLPDTSLLIMPLFLIVSVLPNLARNHAALGLIAWAAGLCLGYLPQGIASLLLYGRWSPSSPTELGQAFHPLVLSEALVSIGYEGWISWTPIVALGLIGLVGLTRRTSSAARRLAFAAILGSVALYLTDVFHPYGRPGAAFGGRRYVSASPLIAIGLAGILSIPDNPHIRRTFLAIIAALVAWNLWLFLCYELLVNLYRVYPTLLQTTRFAIGLGPP
jgi:hypothetical protein